MAKDKIDKWMIGGLVFLAIYFFITLSGWRSVVVSGFFLIWAYKIDTQ
jgi:hypothetical protein